MVCSPLCEMLDYVGPRGFGQWVWDWCGDVLNLGNLIYQCNPRGNTEPVREPSRGMLLLSVALVALI